MGGQMLVASFQQTDMQKAIALVVINLEVRVDVVLRPVSYTKSNAYRVVGRSGSAGVI
jgi:hypothetical protein